jgi:hypothetical protein
MKEVRRGKCARVVVAILALLANQFAPLTVAHAGAFGASPFGTLVVCTAGGAQARPAAPRSDGHAVGDHCPFCTLCGGLFLVESSRAPGIFGPTRASPAAGRQRASVLPVHLGSGGVRARAPPLSA